MTSIIINSWDVDVNCLDEDGNTPLHICAEVGDCNSMTLLLDNGANPSLANLEGVMPLHVACSKGTTAQVTLLLHHGADVNAASIFGWTPLHIACFSGNLAVVENLFQHGCSVNVESKQGVTPAHIAAKLNFRDLYEYLCSHGANQQAQDHDGVTPSSLMQMEERAKFECMFDQELVAGHSPAERKDGPKQRRIISHNNSLEEVRSEFGVPELSITATNSNSLFYNGSKSNSGLRVSVVKERERSQSKAVGLFRKRADSYESRTSSNSNSGDDIAARLEACQHDRQEWQQKYEKVVQGHESKFEAFKAKVEEQLTSWCNSYDKRLEEAERENLQLESELIELRRRIREQEQVQMDLEKQQLTCSELEAKLTETMAAKESWKEDATKWQHEYEKVEGLVIQIPKYKYLATEEKRKRMGVEKKFDMLESKTKELNRAYQQLRATTATTTTGSAGGSANSSQSSAVPLQPLLAASEPILSSLPQPQQPAAVVFPSPACSDASTMTEESGSPPAPAPAPSNPSLVPSPSALLPPKPKAADGLRPVSKALQEENARLSSRIAFLEGAVLNLGGEQGDDEERWKSTLALVEKQGIQTADLQAALTKALIRLSKWEQGSALSHMVLDLEEMVNTLQKTVTSRGV